MPTLFSWRLVFLSVSLKVNEEAGCCWYRPRDELGRCRRWRLSRQHAKSYNNVHVRDCFFVYPLQINKNRSSIRAEISSQILTTFDCQIVRRRRTRFSRIQRLPLYQVKTRGLILFNSYFVMEQIVYQRFQPNFVKCSYYCPSKGF